MEFWVQVDLPSFALRTLASEPKVTLTTKVLTYLIYSVTLLSLIRKASKVLTWILNQGK